MSLAPPVVSIIVAAYEGINYLPATIDSILQQTADNFEIIVFGDDYERIKPYFERQRDARLKFRLQGNFGLADTYNQGILEARGKYISLVKAGDVWHPSNLQKQIFCLDRYPHIGLVYSGSIALERHNLDPHDLVRQLRQGWQVTEIVNTQFSRVSINSQPHNSIGSLEILADNQLPSSSVMFRMSCLETVGLFQSAIQTIPEWEMWIRLNRHYEFMAIAEPLVYLRQLQIGEDHLCLEMERDLQTIIEQIYAMLPSEQERQRQRSYAYASLCLAERVLQAKHSDLAIAQNYWYQALQHDPLIIFAAKFCRQRWVIFYLSCLQSNRYSSLRQGIRNAGDRCQSLIIVFGEYSQKIINWMLEEEDSINFWKNRKVKQQGKDL